LILISFTLLLENNNNYVRRMLFACVEWHQFDGIAQPGANWFMQLIQNASAQHQAHSLVAASAALPLWEGLCSDPGRAVKNVTAEQALEAVDNARICIEFSFLTLHGAVQGNKFLSDVSFHFTLYLVFMFLM